jgi:hypothetical protein
MAVGNTLAYYDTVIITTVKSFMVEVTGVLVENQLDERHLTDRMLTLLRP